MMGSDPVQYSHENYRRSGAGEAVVYPPLPPPPRYGGRNTISKSCCYEESSSSSSWGGFGDSEIKRKKRVVSYKAYSIEGKMKASFRGGFRWIKNKCCQLLRGY